MYSKSALRNAFWGFVCFAFCLSGCESFQKPLVIGHRGSPGYRLSFLPMFAHPYRPEESLESYEIAIDQGTDFVEGDLLSTKDHVLITMHTNQLSETTDVEDHPEFADRKTTKVISGKTFTGWFSEDFTIAEIRTLRLKERFPFRNHMFDELYQIPTLEEMLQLVQAKQDEVGRTVGVYLETKDPSYFRSIYLPLEEPLVDILNQYGYSSADSPVFIESFETNNLKLLKTMTPVPLVQLINSASMVQYDTGRLYAELITPEGLHEVATYAAGIGPIKTLILPPAPSTATELVNRAHAIGLIVHPWTFRNETQYYDVARFSSPMEEYETFFQLGVDGVFSDQPLTAVAAKNMFLGITPECPDSTATLQAL